jgi:hypothetical protein
MARRVSSLIHSQPTPISFLGPEFNFLERFPGYLIISLMLSLSSIQFVPFRHSLGRLRKYLQNLCGYPAGLSAVTDWLGEPHVHEDSFGNREETPYVIARDLAAIAQPERLCPGRFARVNGKSPLAAVVVQIAEIEPGASVAFTATTSPLWISGSIINSRPGSTLRNHNILSELQSK